ncbi:TetR/AcrR family transcriptional regulator [Prescottella agglutinans]|uniref:AcrR family transcriptional regulator n=1 Tax=Prescottella agglutinans TaxID=1644129 RepID=A0ABT6M9L8_9NOCA|nr:TetR/AcrR family transcriptional regulator [Prescottella agglutinans]MDH6280089.1 AcrR family transcriptional regulator [Prescottella agglutinans]
MTSGRGQYAKGARKRAEILTIALEVFAEEGYRGTSLRTVAQRSGLTVAGVMHYFESREHLLTEVIMRRDLMSQSSWGELFRSGATLEELAAELDTNGLVLEDLLDVLERNEQQPGLVELFVTLTAAAHDPEHPAHDRLRERYEGLEQLLTAGVARMQERGELRDDIAAGEIARLVIAVADGTQLQWLVTGEGGLSGPMATLWYDVLGASRPTKG